MNYDLAIIGGGAAGMAAAVFASENGVRTVVIEHNRQLGKKPVSYTHLDVYKRQGEYHYQLCGDIHLCGRTYREACSRECGNHLEYCFLKRHTLTAHKYACE